MAIVYPHADGARELRIGVAPVCRLPHETGERTAAYGPINPSDAESSLPSGECRDAGGPPLADNVSTANSQTRQFLMERSLKLALPWVLRGCRSGP
jgi:hypothetical protein